MKAKICLVIHRSDDDREVFEAALHNVDKKLCCIAAASSSQAIRTLTQHRNFAPDYIFVDLNMPRVNGERCITLLRQLHQLQHTPVITYSSSLSSDDVEDPKQLGAAAHIYNPLSVQQLETKLKAFFTGYRRNDFTYVY